MLNHLNNTSPVPALDGTASLLADEDSIAIGTGAFPPSRELKCLQWSLDPELCVKAAFGNFIQLGIDAKKPLAIAKRLSDLIPRSVRLQIHQQFEAAIQDKVNPPSIRLMFKVGEKTLHIRQETILQFSEKGDPVA